MTTTGPASSLALEAIARRICVLREEKVLPGSGLARRFDELVMTTESLEMQHDTFSRNTRNQLKQVFDAVRELMTPIEPPKRPIGFVTPEEKKDKGKAKGN